MKTTRIEEFLSELRNEGLSDYEIAAGLGNGDVERPGWLSVAEDTDNVKLWDNETDADSHMGFVAISYDQDEA